MSSAALHVRSLRPLLPAGNELALQHPGQVSAITAGSKRSTVSVACEACRKRKSKVSKVFNDLGVHMLINRSVQVSGLDATYVFDGQPNANIQQARKRPIRER